MSDSYQLRFRAKPYSYHGKSRTRHRSVLAQTISDLVQTKSHQIRSEQISSNSCHISSSSDHIAPTLCVHWCVGTHIDCLFQCNIRLKVCWHQHFLFTCAMQPTQFASFILKSGWKFADTHTLSSLKSKTSSHFAFFVQKWIFQFLP